MIEVDDPQEVSTTRNRPPQPCTVNGEQPGTEKSHEFFVADGAEGGGGVGGAESPAERGGEGVELGDAEEAERSKLRNSWLQDWCLTRPLLVGRSCACLSPFLKKQ